MDREIADKCLIVFNSYKELNLERAQKIFQKSFQKKYNKRVHLKVVQLQEPAGIGGNLAGYLSAYKRLSKKLTKKEIKSFDTIIFIHDAGLAVRLFPLTYEYSSPLKSTVRFPRGSAIELLFDCIANVPLLKESVIILPVDQYFKYESVDAEGLSKSLKNYTFSMIVTPVSIKRALGSLGTVQLGKNNRIELFYEKTEDENLIPRYSKESTLANTFQLITTKDSLDKLQKALNLFTSKPENLSFIKKLDNAGWCFNKLVCESLTLKNEQLSDVQIAMKECLSRCDITVGGIIAQGYWEDWASTITSYINTVRKLTKESEKPVDNNNYFIRSKKIAPSGILKSCIFIDCNTVDLFGDFENCIFVNCAWVRVMSSQKTNNALFYSLRKLNFLRRTMSDYVYSRFVSGRRHIEFECEKDINFKDLWKAMKKTSDDWTRYYKTAQIFKTKK